MLTTEQVQFQTYVYGEPQLTIEEQRYASLVRFYCTMYPFLCSINKYKRWYDVKKALVEKAGGLKLFLKKWIRKTKKYMRAQYLFWRL